MRLEGTVTELRTIDVRFPTSQFLHGSDAMHPDGDYSAAYVVLGTDRGDGVAGHGLAFTIGRGNEVVVQAIEALRPLVVGRSIAEIVEAPGDFSRSLTHDSQLRWLGPEKGVIHMAAAAVVNAGWDLRAKLEQKPLWKVLCDLSPAQIVEIVDWRYLTDALTPGEAQLALDRLVRTRAAREKALIESGYPAYNTSVGWLGYTDQRLRELCLQGIEDGFDAFKLKVGASLEDDLRRTAVAREAIGPNRVLMIDANQRWDVAEAIDWVRALADRKPLWIEEPTSPDDVLGHVAIARALEPLGIGVATGEHCANRVMFKQFLAARAIAYCQIDVCRLAGIDEVVAVLLLANRFGVPVCPHAGGTGLCEYVQHASIFDYVAVSGSLEGRRTEFVEHLHEHFVDPCVVCRGRYVLPRAPGTSITMKAESLEAYEFPRGRIWRDARKP
ncbi:MAG: fuconate dehydratase [Myxococcales bacterium]|nr:fuconate dehydratase [Myxococcales bacterium]